MSKVVVASVVVLCLFTSSICVGAVWKVYGWTLENRSRAAQVAGHAQAAATLREDTARSTEVVLALADVIADVREAIGLDRAEVGRQVGLARAAAQAAALSARQAAQERVRAERALHTMERLRAPAPQQGITTAGTPEVTPGAAPATPNPAARPATRLSTAIGLPGIAH